MTGNDQYLFTIISSISNDIYRYSKELCDFIDSTFEQSALPLREALYDAHWWPVALKPPTPDGHAIPAAQITEHGAWYWLQQNKAANAAILAFVLSGTTFGLWVFWENRRKHYVRKRRVRGWLRGVKTHVVVVAGTPNASLSRSVILDLERRGFIVYVVIGHPRDEEVIEEFGNVDILPLPLNITNVADTQRTLQRFAHSLQNPWGLNPDTPCQRLHLAGLVLIPDTTYPTGPIEIIDLAVWSDVFNARVLNTIATTQAFLPLIRKLNSRILLLIPCINSSLRSPFHSVETTTVHALGSYMDTLAAELHASRSSIIQLKLGSIDYITAAGLQRLQQTKHREIMAWPADVRTVYARKFIAQQQRFTPGKIGLDYGTKTCSLREVNNAVFDALTQQQPARLMYVGRGSSLYDVVGRWFSLGVIGKMLSWKHPLIPYEVKSQSKNQIIHL